MAENKQGGLGALLSIGLGVAAGWGLRKLLQEKYEQTSGMGPKSVSDKELITTVFGEYSKEIDEFYHQVQEEVMDQVKQLHLSLKEIDTQKYKELVTEALKKMQKEKTISKKQLDALQKYLMDDLAQIQAKAKKTAANRKKVEKLTEE
jgi:hypothetical protein